MGLPRRLRALTAALSRFRAVHARPAALAVPGRESSSGCARRVSRFLHETVYENLAQGNMNRTQSETVTSLMTPLERRMARKALSRLLASEGNWTDAQARAVKSARENARAEYCGTRRLPEKTPYANRGQKSQVSHGQVRFSEVSDKSDPTCTGERDAE